MTLACFAGRFYLPMRLQLGNRLTPRKIFFGRGLVAAGRLLPPGRGAEGKKKNPSFSLATSRVMGFAGVWDK